MGTDAGWSNTLGGVVDGPVIQAGVVHGGIHLYEPATPRAIPRQLPCVPSSWTDRAAESAALDQILAVDDRHGPGLVVLTGPGGIGKTALASRWVTRNNNLFPDGQLFADLGGCWPAGPLTAQDLLARFLRALGVPAGQIPDDATELRDFYCSVTADRAIAIVADDAASPAQVRPLLPASRAGVVIVTSRRHLPALTLDGARTLVVGPLAQSAAVTLLQHILGDDRVAAELDATQELARLCAGVPLALGLAAARLAMRPHWPISRLADTLSDHRRLLPALTVDKESTVEEGLALSYQELDTAAARLYRLLSLHPGPEFGSGVAAAAVDLPCADAEIVLADLVEANLIEDTGPDRHRFHALAHVHAREEAQKTESAPAREEALRRMVVWYLDYTIMADRVIMPLRRRIGDRATQHQSQAPPFANPVVALDWLEHELDNLVAVVDAAAAQQWWEEIWQLCEGLWSVFLYRKHYPQWVRTHETGIEAARRCGNPRAEARLHVQLGYAHLNTGRHDAARRHFTASLEIGTACADPATQATAWEHLGLAARSSGHLDRALTHFTTALLLSEQLDEHRAIALHLRRLGETYADLDRLPEALDHLTRAVTAAGDLGDTVLLARALTRLGSLHNRMDQRQEAHTTLVNAVDILSQHGASSYAGEAHEALAEVCLRTGDQQAARTQLQQALDIYTPSGDPKAGRVRNHLAALDADHPHPD